MIDTGGSSCLIVSVVVLILLVVDLEVAQFVRVSRRRDHAQPVTQVVLLQVLLRQVLQVPSTESTWMKQQVILRQVLQVPSTESTWVKHTDKTTGTSSSSTSGT